MVGVMSNNRVLMFDLLRIIAILMVVLGHTAGFLKIQLFQETLWTPCMQAIMPGSLPQWGVALFIFISGSVLEYKYGKKVWSSNDNFDFKLFIVKRLIRIYPAFWLSMLIGVAFGSNVGIISSINWSILIKELTGFYAFFSATQPSLAFNGYYNGVSWFIGTIICLYLIYPIITRFLKNNGISGLVLILLVVIFIRLLSSNGIYNQYWYWNPLSRMAEFALGIYIVQVGFYVKTANTSRFIQFLSDITFPIFLVHSLMFYIFQKALYGYYMDIIVYTIIVLLLSLVVYFIDYRLKLIFERSLNYLMNKKTINSM